MRKLIKAFTDDIRIESVQFQMQAGLDVGEPQHNDIIGTFDFTTLDGRVAAGVLGKQLRRVEDLLISSDPIPQLVIIIDDWNKSRIEIQYAGYGHGENSIRNRSIAYCYVLLLRILKTKHRTLYMKIVKRQNKKMHILMKNRLTND